MCLIAYHWQAGELTLIANRDEFHARPALTAQWWDDGAWLGGRDQQAGGTWLAMGHRGRIAAVTNFRRPGEQQGAKSRGDLPLGFVTTGVGLDDYARQVAGDDGFGGFNLLLFDPREGLRIASNRSVERVTEPAPGLGSVCNGDVGHRWPKMETAEDALGRAIAAESLERDWVALLRDERRPPSESLPDTGVGAEMESFLSSLFICDERYGTRASTLVRVASGRFDFREVTWSPTGERTGQVAFSGELVAGRG